ncbi:AraC family transcriptional regulator [Gracilibacillus caseinilyticus]|uniref:AraC family transcriptional regulator n=1 Tax=Gracilibacillus caseinilyticus TaxID=2932256 RepID=A0ABY4F122_9BACI|nr:AraC family transcriptional regulator [Gracilibacillus caseinilyticus]UOQ50378.1 AraC family transcriptional regulator [Gracilibacillus caseinilyticus]
MKLKVSQFIKENDFPFCINHKVHTDRNAPPLHAHDFIELVYVMEGKGDHVCDGESYPLTAGDVFIINPGEQHTYIINQKDKLEIVNCLFMPYLFDAVWLKGLGITESMDYFYVHPFLEKEERFHHCINLRGNEADQIYCMFEKMCYEYEGGQHGYESIIRLQLVQLLIELSRIYLRVNDGQSKIDIKQQERKTFIHRISGYLERHADQKLTLTTLSELFGISSRHLNRIFKEETGRTVVEYIHEIRMNRAKKLLVETSEKIIVIAMEVGYDDPAFFTRLFTRKVGCSPGRYREQLALTRTNLKEEKI